MQKSSSRLACLCPHTYSLTPRVSGRLDWTSPSHILYEQFVLEPYLSIAEQTGTSQTDDYKFRQLVSLPIESHSLKNIVVFSSRIGHFSSEDEHSSCLLDSKTNRNLNSHQVRPNFTSSRVYVFLAHYNTPLPSTFIWPDGWRIFKNVFAPPKGKGWGRDDLDFCARISPHLYASNGFAYQTMTLIIINLENLAQL